MSGYKEWFAFLRCLWFLPQSVELTRTSHSHVHISYLHQNDLEKVKLVTDIGICVITVQSTVVHYNGNFVMFVAIEMLGTWEVFLTLMFQLYNWDPPCGLLSMRHDLVVPPKAQAGPSRTCIGFDANRTCTVADIGLYLSLAFYAIGIILWTWMDGMVILLIKNIYRPTLFLGKCIESRCYS